jgi:hypothetical protein
LAVERRSGAVPHVVETRLPAVPTKLRPLKARSQLFSGLVELEPLEELLPED